jgi:hypothetical protein
MTETLNGGLPEAAATRVGEIDGSALARCERTAALIESDDDADLLGFATYTPCPAEDVPSDNDTDFSDLDTCAPPAGAAPAGDKARTGPWMRRTRPRALGASMSRK